MEKEPLRDSWNSITIMNLMKIGFSNVDWLEMAQYWV
jgi:hypothetical protein